MQTRHQGGAMKHIFSLLVISLFILSACEYQEPLAENQNIAIDPALLGLWQPAPDKDEPAPTDEWILALKYSETEYLIHYKTGGGSMYFRAYPINVGGISCMQLQLLGNDSGPLKESGQAYHVAFLVLRDDEVTIRMLNTSVVNPKLKGAELKDTFLKNSTTKELFREPAKFKRAKKSS
jgi:hypothetical protein